jgi:hypothetical protein
MKEVMVQPAKFRTARIAAPWHEGAVGRCCAGSRGRCAGSKGGPKRRASKLWARATQSCSMRGGTKAAGRPPKRGERHADGSCGKQCAERAIVWRGEAREIVTERAKRLFEHFQPPGEHWQEARLTLRCGRNRCSPVPSVPPHVSRSRERLADYFVGIAHLALTRNTGRHRR